MATSFVTPLLLGAALLLGASGCSQQQAAKPVGTGSYQLDGRAITCQATARLFTGNKGIDILYVNLTTTPQPAGGPEVLSLVFQKVKGHADTDYTHMDAYYTRDGQSTLQGVRYVHPQALVAPTASGGFSGTVEAMPDSGTTGVIQTGTFTEAQVQ